MVPNYKYQDIQLELTSYCNLCCSFCPSEKLKRKRANLSLDKAKTIINEVATHSIAPSIYFHAMGEPLLHPDLDEIINFAKSRGLFTKLYTNGSLLKQSRLELLLNTGLDYLNVSVNCHDQESMDYKYKNKSPITFENYMDQILYAVDLKASKKYNLSTLRFSHLTSFEKNNNKRRQSLEGMVMKNSFSSYAQVFENLNKYTKYISKLGLGIQVYDQLLVEKLTKNYRNILELSPGIFMVLYPIGTWGNNKKELPLYQSFYGRCSSVISRSMVSISAQGEVCFCCYDYEFETSVGRYGVDGNLNEILESKKCKQFQKQMEYGILKNDRCKKCLGSNSRSKLITRNLTSIFKPIEPIVESY